MCGNSCCPKVEQQESTHDFCLGANNRGLHSSSQNRNNSGDPYEKCSKEYIEEEENVQDKNKEEE